MTAGDIRDITKSYLPLLAVIGVVFFAFQGGIAYQGITNAPGQVSQRVDALEIRYKNDMAGITESIKELSITVKDLQRTLTDPITTRLPDDLLRYSELRVFCLELQVANPSITLKCPERRRP